MGTIFTMAKEGQTFGHVTLTLVNQQIICPKFSGVYTLAALSYIFTVYTILGFRPMHCDSMAGFKVIHEQEEGVPSDTNYHLLCGLWCLL